MTLPRTYEELLTEVQSEQSEVDAERKRLKGQLNALNFRQAHITGKFQLLKRIKESAETELSDN